jgi:hypothetical protein
MGNADWAVAAINWILYASDKFDPFNHSAQRANGVIASISGLSIWR